MLLPIDFSYWVFAVLIALNGIASGMFASPNSSSIMGSVPAHLRGVASGMRATFQNSGTAVSIGVFFSLMIAGLASSLPHTLTAGLQQQGVPAHVAAQVGGLPPVSSLFAAQLGVNPVQHLLQPSGALAHLTAAQQQSPDRTRVLPDLISGPFHSGLVIVFAFGAVPGTARRDRLPAAGRRHRPAHRAKGAGREPLRAHPPLPPTAGRGQRAAESAAHPARTLHAPRPASPRALRAPAPAATPRAHTRAGITPAPPGDTTMALTTIDPTSALVVIDLQKGIVPAHLDTPVDRRRGAGDRLAAEFRRHGLPVILVNVTGRAPGRTETVRSGAGTALPAGWSDLIDELDVQPTDHLITKRRRSAFHDTGLDTLLRDLGVTQVVLAGISTSSGVESTARAAADHGYHVVLATDAMSDPDTEAHRHSVERVFPKLGETATTAEITDMVEATR